MFYFIIAKVSYYSRELILFSLLAPLSAGVFSNNLGLEIRVGDAGGVVDIVGTVTTSSYPVGSPVLMLIPLPVSLKEGYKILTSQDTKINVSAAGNKYTFLTLIAESSNKPIVFEIKEGISYEETVEGKAKLEVYPEYKYLTKIEKFLIKKDFSISSLDISFYLPEKYDYTELGYGTSIKKTPDQQIFKVDKIMIPSPTKDQYWIVFPNPDAKRFLYAILFLTFGVSALSIYKSHKNLYKNNHKNMVILLISTVLLSLLIYSGMTLQKNIVFLVSVSALIPYIIYSFVYMVFLLFFAKRYVGQITGAVYKDNIPMKTATVYLDEKINNIFEELTRHDENDKSDFNFDVYLFSKSARFFRIRVIMAGVQDEISDEFTISRSNLNRTKEVIIKLSNIT